MADSSIPATLFFPLLGSVPLPNENLLREGQGALVEEERSHTEVTAETVFHHLKSR